MRPTGVKEPLARRAPEHDGRRLPAEIRCAIVELKAEHPPLRSYEIATICRRRFHRPVSHHTVARVLAAEPLPVNPPRRVLRYHETADPVRRRRAIVCLAGEGWTSTAIAGCAVVPRCRRGRMSSGDSTSSATRSRGDGASGS